MKGVWTPLVTPMFRGSFDGESMRRLLDLTAPYADGYVVGLSSGEGDALSPSLWKSAVGCAVAATRKPVAAALMGGDVGEIAGLAPVARDLGCMAIVVPAAGATDEETLAFVSGARESAALPLVLYNTEAHPLRSPKSVAALDAMGVAAIKDSSGDERFFAQLLKMKPKLRMSVLQGVEDKLLQSKGCDGYMISLANVEPALCRQMFDHPGVEANAKILQKFHEYNLAGQWYVTLKALLYGRGVLRSAEQVRLARGTKKLLFDSSVHLGQFAIADETTRIACKNSQAAISEKPRAELTGVVSFNENSWTDDAVWALDRETQDVFYKFMDVFHTVKAIERAPLSADDAKLALRFAAEFQLDFSNALTCAIAVSRGVNEVHTFYESLLAPDVTAALDRNHSVRIVAAPNGAGERKYKDMGLEAHYQAALKQLRARDINLPDMLHK